jgi:hypothetical protein
VDAPFILRLLVNYWRNKHIGSENVMQRQHLEDYGSLSCEVAARALKDLLSQAFANWSSVQKLFDITL